MAELLAIYRNGVLAHEFDKRAALERMLFAYVQRMDADMDRGVSIDGERILSPSQTQRNQFVVGQLLEALSINDSPSIVQHRHVMPLSRAACVGSRHHSHRRRWRRIPCRFGLRVRITSCGDVRPPRSTLSGFCRS